MPTPVAPLLNAIAASPFRVRPEMFADLDEFVSTECIELEFIEGTWKLAEVVPGRGLIRLGVPFLETLWAAAHAYIVVFRECQKASQAGARAFAIAAQPCTANAYSLYRDLLVGHAYKNPIDWPTGNIRPERYPPEGTDSYIANELFLVAVAWIIHHEIAHVRLKHQPLTINSMSMQEERQADLVATRWLCEQSPDLQPLRKCAMGIVAAVLFLLAHELESGRSSSSHPQPFERLIWNLDTTGLEENDMVYSFAFKLVEIHLLQSALPHEIDRAGSYRDMLVSACLALRSGS